MKIVFSKLETNKKQLEVRLNRFTSAFYDVETVKEDGIDLTSPVFEEADNNFAIVGAATKIVPEGMEKVKSEPYTYLYMARHYTYGQAAELTYGELSSHANEQTTQDE